MSVRSLRTHPLVLRHLRVESTRPITPRLVRVRFVGEQLGDFEAAGRKQPAFTSPAFDDHVKMLFSASGPVEDVLPVQLPHGIEWTRSPERVTRDYTPRRVEPGVLEMDFVLGHDGPASRFAENAREGDEAWIVGPKSSTVLPDELDWIVLVGDETAIPAIARFLEERPSHVPADVYVLHTGPQARLDLPVRDQDRLHWVEVAADHDDETPLRIVREHDWRDGDGYVWGAGESKAFLAVRRHLTKERSMPADRVNVTGYWHHRATSETPRPLDLETPTVHWFAARAALRAGVLDALAAADLHEPGTIASSLGIRPDVLQVLLDVLGEAGIARAEGGRVGLTDHGKHLADDDHEREHLDGFGADVLLSLAHLDEALTADTSSWAAARGETLQTTSTTETEVREELVEHAELLGFVLDALVALPWWTDASRVGLCGPAAVVVAHTARDRGVATPFVVAEEPALLETLRESGTVADTELGQELGRCDAVVAALALAHRTDDEARALLSRLRDDTERLVVVEAFRRDALGGGSAASTLLTTAMNGSGPRSEDRVARLAADAGWATTQRTPLGWGFGALVLEPA